MQFLMNSARAEQPVPEREHSGPEEPILQRGWRDKKSREAQRLAAKRQNYKTNQTELNWNGSPPKDRSGEPEKPTPIIYKAW